MIAVMSSFSQCFPSTLKRKDGVFKFLQLKERFRKNSVFVTGRMDGRSDRWDKVFSPGP